MTGACTQPMVNDGVDPRVERSIEKFNDHDLDGLLEEFAEGGTFNDPLLEEPVTEEEIRDYTREIFTAFPDVRLEVKRVINSGDRAYAIEGNYTGTHRGPIEGVPPTGKSVVVPSVTVIDVSTEGITSWRDYWDQETFTEQLGLGFPGIIPLIPKMALAKVKNIA